MERSFALCQSCGMPLAALEHFGTNSDNTPSVEYCCFCYREGRFTDAISLREKIADSVAYHDESQKENGRTLTRNELSVRMHLLYPKLGRWASHENCHVRYYKAVDRVVEYINENLASPLSLAELARISCISEFHFHRIFRAVMGEAPGEYIQRLRLEKGAFMLTGGKMPVGEVASRIGYDSQQSFSRAFRNRYGIAPGSYRDSPVEVRFPVDESANLGVEPDIRRRDGFTLSGVRVDNACDNSRAFLDAWNKLSAVTGKRFFEDLSDEYILLSLDCSTITRPEHYNIYACVSPRVKSRPLRTFDIRGGEFAVFTHRGPYSQLGRMYCHIYRWWIPYSGYSLRDGIYFEKFVNSPEDVDQSELVTEVWIPVERYQPSAIE